MLDPVHATVLTALLVAPALAFGPAGQEAGSAAAAGAPGAERDVSEVLEGFRSLHQVAGLAAVAVGPEGIEARGVCGVRTKGADSALTARDAVRIGKCTVAVTALLAAAMVDAGDVEWGTTLGETFDVPMHEAWKPVTLMELLTNFGGMPEYLLDGGLWNELTAHRGTGREQRRDIVRHVLKAPPPNEPGKWSYSEPGIAVAAAMLEAAADATWETLVRERVFEPLGMEDAGFGDPDAARGHNHDGTPRAPGEGRAWPAAMDPVRAVHASLEDMARLGRALLPGSGFLEPETLGRIRAPLPPGERSDARPGFIIVALAEGPMLFAESGVDDWSALLWVMLDRDVAAFAACNQGGSIAGTATHKAMNEVVSGGD